MTGPRALVFVACALLALFARDASAHARSVSWSAWTVRASDVEVRVRVARMDLDAARVTGDGEAAYLESRLRVEGPAGECPVVDGSFERRPSTDDDVARTWRMRCKGAGPLRVTSDLFVDVIPSHVHFASRMDGDEAVADHLLTADARSWTLVGNGDASASAGLGDFLLLGIRHVAGGADHLVFLLALLVGAASARALVAVVTGFTIGHSLTLALAVFGVVHPDAASVEALIGASIAVVAVENVWLEGHDPWIARALVVALVGAAGASALHASIGGVVLGGLALFVACHLAVLARVERPANLRWTIAALFGAVHGLAFSSVLRGMHLPRARLASSLFGFNVGVEVAQLAIVAVAWPVWMRVARGPARGPAIDVASAAALGLGAFWFVERAFGG